MENAEKVFNVLFICTTYVGNDNEIAFQYGRSLSNADKPHQCFCKLALHTIDLLSLKQSIRAIGKSHD